VNLPTDDPNWPRASAWLSAPAPARTAGALALLSVPLREGAITPGRCDLAPAAFRAALSRFSTWDFVTDGDLRDLVLRDHGELAIRDAMPADAVDTIARAVTACLADADALVLLGGNNALTRPAMLGIPALLEDCALLTLDAHLDLRDLDEGYSNGNPVRALLRDGLPGAHIVQVGIQSFANSGAYARVARDAGITVIPVEEVRRRGIAGVVAAALAQLSERALHIYVDLDLDVLDRSFAPGAPGSRPGGLAPWELQEAARLCGRHPRVCVLDVVEVDPTRDVADITVLSGAACLLAFAAGLRSRGSSG
jgi:arginase family enzyme